MSPTIPPQTESEKERLEQANRFRRDDVSRAAGRIAFFQYLTVGVFLFLISGFWRLQIDNPAVYSEQADRNRIKSIPILAPRGKILDRDGRVIVDNHSSFSLILSRDNLKEEHLKPIADGLNMDFEDLKERVRRFRKRPTYEAIVIKEELTPAEMAFVESHRDPGTFPELELIHAQRRLYPKEGFAAHMIGYVGEVSEPELNSAEFIDYEPGDVVGKQGLERQYNKQLMGIDGERRVVVDKLGIPRQVIDDKPAVPGKNLQTSIDLDLQSVAELALADRRGAIVALDPRNGEILAMVSRPAYDPNRFAGRIRSKDWKEIIENPDKPLLNRAIQSRLAPGSTFKPVMSLAGLEEGVVNDNFRVHCSGGASFYGHYHACHKKGGHGTVGLRQAIAGSCDVFFYTLGNQLGIDTIAKYAEMAGFGSKSGVDLPHESDGLVPSTKWKMRAYRQKWYAGETISVAIGQGALEVSPIQLARAIGGIAMGGVWQTPHIAKEEAGRSEARKASVNAENVLKVIDGMYAVVNDGGTAPMARLPGITLCGKTGTAQLASNAVLKGTAAGREMKDNGWFVGFAPRENPEIVVVALVEAGLHGTTASLPVRDIVKAYFDKKVRSTPKDQLATAPTLDPRAALQRLMEPQAGRQALESSALIARLGEQGVGDSTVAIASYRSLREIDWPLLLITLAICGLGILQIYSATLGTAFRDAWLRQVAYIAVGLLCFFIASRIDYHSLLSHSYWMYGICLLGLIGVFVIGTVAGGARRWIPLFGGFKLQVSEFVKIVLVLLLARVLTELKKEELDWRDLAKVGGLILLPSVLVAKQPDLGTALTYLPVLLVGILLAGVRWQYVAIGVLALAIALPVAWHFLHDYQRARLTTFVDPSQDPRGSGYQVIQSMIAVGHGGMWGQGPTQGTQTQLQFLPISHTDFIFSSFAEEHGFVGVVVVLGLYFLLLMQIVQNAQTAPDGAGMYICMGIAGILLFHVLVNVGMVVGRMPVTGIPLPLMSAGGSNTLSVFMLLGLVNNVRLRRFVN